MDFVRNCEACQRLGNLIHAPSVEMGRITSTWPFHIWSIDLIGPISPLSRRNIWILAATENFTKWSEAISFQKATSQVVKNFVEEEIIYYFGIPMRVLFDNGSPFTGQPFELLMREYQIHHGKSTRYYPQGNGLIDSFNNTLAAIISKMIKEASRNWEDFLSLAVQAYSVTPHLSNPFIKQF